MPKNGLIRQHDHSLGILIRVLDAVIIVGVLFAVKQAYLGGGWGPRWSVVAFSAVAVFYLAANINHLYQSYRLGGIVEEMPRLIMTWLMTLAGLLLLGYLLKVAHTVSRVTLTFWAVITPVALLVVRQLIRSFLYQLRKEGRNTRSVVIIGANENAKRLAAEISRMPWAGLRLLGFVTQEHEGSVCVQDESSSGLSVPVLGTLEDLFARARDGGVDMVYIATPTSEREVIESVIHELGDSTVSIFVVPDFHTAAVMQGNWVSLGGIPTVSIIDDPAQGLDAVAKRLEDLLLAGAALAFFALPMLLIALGVKLSSPGPVFYKQRRYGLSGRSFNMLKFRSMSVTEKDEEFVQASRNDTRVTPFGAFLRRTSLDELPQFLNVLNGEMSVVGPRPHAAAHNEEFRSRISGYMLRHKAKPGITGLAQVNGFRGETDTDEKMRERVRFDVEYINNWSIWMDLAIVLKTPWVLFTAKNAY